MHDPWESHLAFLKHILHYVKGTLSFGFRIGTSPVDSLAVDSQRSTSGYCVFLGNTLVSWSSKCQITVF
jgi:hypothetical protein